MRIARNEHFMDADRAVDDTERVAKAVKELRESMAPPGAFNLPPLLEKRRLEHLIPDGAFKIQPSFDHVYVYQIGEKDTTGPETFGETSIIKPEIRKEYDKAETPRGIIVGAGLLALDALRSHGMGLGHIVRILRNAPWRMPIGYVGSTSFGVFVMASRHVSGSEDLAAALLAGTVRITYEEVTNQYGDKVFRHLYVDEEGRAWNPVDPGE